MRLKELRITKAVTQREVSSHIGVSEIVYSRYERGIREPSLDTLVRLAEYFGVSTDFLLEREPVSGEVLTDYEKQLLSAFRNADQRAREDALTTLLNHTVAGKKGKSA